MLSSNPNLVFVFGDQWRAQAFGYAGDRNAQTPQVDRFASQSFNFTNAVTNCPVCCPARATLLTGQYPLTHDVIVNDVPIRKTGQAFAEVLKAQYDTAYIGKWHVDGHGRSAFIPPERRLGFDFWRGFECTHDYFDSGYFSDSGELLKWPGYDASSQTDEAMRYIREHDSSKPFALFLSWGPPHSPYDAVPDTYKARFPKDAIHVPENVPSADRERAQTELAGYYAHGAALDDCFCRLLDTIDAAGLTEDTIIVFTSDHGDTLHAHGSISPKQQPWDESIRVPLLIRVPSKFGGRVGSSTFPIGIVDLMPTCLALCGQPIPTGVQGIDRSGLILGTSPEIPGAALIANYVPFHEASPEIGGKEWRGVRTERYTYARDLSGPWLLYDNERDPDQLINLVGDSNSDAIQAQLDLLLTQLLDKQGDKFESGEDYLARWNYVRDFASNEIPNHF